MSALANSFGEAICEALHTSVDSTKQYAEIVPENVVIAAAINGGVLGVMQFMADMRDAGRLSNPDEKLGLMLQMATDVWMQIRGGPAGAHGDLQ